MVVPIRSKGRVSVEVPDAHKTAKQAPLAPPSPFGPQVQKPHEYAKFSPIA